MSLRRWLASGLALGLVGGCAAPVRLLEAPRGEAPGTAAIVAVDVRIWDRFGRQSLPLRQAGDSVTNRARELLAARIPGPPCDADSLTPSEDIADTLALYQRVATVWLADPDAGRAGLGIGPGLATSVGDCETALVLLGQQLPQPGEAASWLALGAINAADGRLLRLAALPLRPDDDLRRPHDLTRRVDQLIDRVYR